MVGKYWLITAEMNFKSTTALRLAESNERPLAIHSSVGRSVAIRAVQFKQTARDETMNR